MEEGRGEGKREGTKILELEMGKKENRMVGMAVIGSAIPSLPPSPNSLFIQKKRSGVS